MPSWTGKSRTSPSNSGSSGSNVTQGKVKQTPLMAVPPIFAGAAEESSRLAAASTCVEPDHRELIRSVATVLYRRIRDNETADSKVITPLFCEDTHTEPEPEDRYEVTLPLYHQQLLSFPTLYVMRKLPPLKLPPPNYPVPSVHIIATFIENIRQKARLTPQSMVITLIYIDRLEARSEGVLLHARSWRPVVFASLLLASKVWHDISYWNSDFQSICPMFNVRNINRMERAYLTRLEYNTIISASQYAQYYFSLRHSVRAPTPKGVDAVLEDDFEAVETGARGAADGAEPGRGRSESFDQKAPLHTSSGSGGRGSSGGGSGSGGGGGVGDNFRSKYLNRLAVPNAARLQEQSAALAEQKKVVEEHAAALLGGSNDRPLPIVLPEMALRQRAQSYYPTEEWESKSVELSAHQPGPGKAVGPTHHRALNRSHSMIEVPSSPELQRRSPPASSPRKASPESASMAKVSPSSVSRAVPVPGARTDDPTPSLPAWVSTSL